MVPEIRYLYALRQVFIMGILDDLPRFILSWRIISTHELVMTIHIEMLFLYLLLPSEFVLIVWWNQECG